MEIRPIYDKLRDGGSITDQELDFALLYFTDLRDKLLDLGPVFQLAAMECHSKVHQLNNYKTAREGW